MGFEFWEDAEDDGYWVFVDGRLDYDAAKMRLVLIGGVGSFDLQYKRMF